MIFWNTKVIITHTDIPCPCLVVVNLKIIFPIIVYNCHCFLHEDVCLIFALTSRSNEPRAIFPNTLPREQGVNLIILSC